MDNLKKVARGQNDIGTGLLDWGVWDLFCK